MMKKFTILLSLIAVSLIIVVVLFNKIEVFSSDNNLKEKQYLYFDAADNVNHTLNKLDVNNKEKQLLLKKAIEGYPTSAYSKKNNKVYFTKVVEDNSTQLFEKDLNNNVIKQLTKDLSFVDFLALNESEQIIYMRVLVGKNDRNFHIATYNLLTSKYNVWDSEDKDTSVVWFDYNTKTNKLLMVAKSIKEEFENIDKANKNKTAPIPPAYKLSISTEDGHIEKEELGLKKFVKSASLSNDGKTILINYKDGIEPDKPSIIAKFSIGGDSFEVLLQDSKQNFNIRQPIYDRKNIGFYFIADDKPIGYSSSVKYFNFRTKEVKHIFHNKKGSIINLYLNE